MVYIAGSLFGALLFISTVQYLALWSMLERTRDRSLHDTIDALLPLVSQSLWTFHEDHAINTVNAIYQNPFVSGVQVSDSTGRFSFAVGDFESTSEQVPKFDKKRFSYQKKAYVIEAPLIIESTSNSKRQSNIGSIRVRGDNALIEQQVNELLRITLASVLLAIVSLQILIYFLVKKTIALPLEGFDRLVQHLSTDMRSQPETPEFANRPDEFGRLTQVFSQQRDELIQRDQVLAQQHQHLEQMVEERTNELQQVNESLVESLTQLKQAQQELIQNEKMASLGALVSGIAHEVNTPLGVSITAASHLLEELHQTQKALNNNKLTKSSFETFMEECDETESLLLNNLNRAAQLIKSFKKISVDQTSEEVRFINLKSYLDEIVLSLRPKLKHTKITVHNETPDNISLRLYPGVLAQIMTNLITNSIIHGFRNGKESGDITIDAQPSGSEIILSYYDNGAGMDEQTLRNIYDPFFTTKRSEGGSGLGMNIVYNLVTSKLKGTIESFSSPGNGLKVIMTIKITEEVKQDVLNE
jgi:two-component system, NtrC family, sensor kinase